jgi:hypothetical protein
MTVYTEVRVFTAGSSRHSLRYVHRTRPVRPEVAMDRTGDPLLPSDKQEQGKQQSFEIVCTTCFNVKTLHSAHAVYLCVPYGSHNKQRLFP